MSDAKDPAIKLFGKTIQLPSDDGFSGEREIISPGSSCSSDEGFEKVGKDLDKDVPEVKDTDKENGKVHSLLSEGLTDPTPTSAVSDNPKTPSADNELTASKTSDAEEEQSENNNSQEKTLKKPDKIIPCPRCNSMDTKFCYFNNYNVNQPRHFCKNCQRYWTAGGTMRNVPVGAGRRKNKSSAPQYRQLSASEALANSQVHLKNGIQQPPILNANANVLSFGNKKPLCESMASVLKIAENPMQPVASCKPETDDHSSGSSNTATNNADSFPPQVPYFPGMPWPYPWNAPMGPTFYPAGFPMPPLIYPAPPFWSCAVPPGPWNVPWVSPPPNNTGIPHSGPKSPNLGKHSRDEDVASNSANPLEEPQKENKPEKCLWIPKTLRINDPNEAAKSPIWDALGIKNDVCNSVSGGKLFKSFQSNGEEKGDKISEASAVLQANPAALSRSVSFQEST